MEKIIKLLYSILPKKVINYIGKSNLLKPFRNKILRPDNVELITKENISWGKGTFDFYAPIKITTKAKTKGIENKLLRNSLKLMSDYNIDNPIILDIGANYGFVSLALQSNLKDNAQIFSFEPHPLIAETFQKSITANKFENIKLINAAVGNKDCEIELNLYGHTSNILSLENRKSQKITINQINLDNYLLKNNIVPNFIKIDVDGYEIEVLEGLKENLLKNSPIMVVETNYEKKVIDFLINECSYKLLDLDLKEFEKIPDNVFCIPNQKIIKNNNFTK